MIKRLPTEKILFNLNKEEFYTIMKQMQFLIHELQIVKYFYKNNFFEEYEVNFPEDYKYIIEKHIIPRFANFIKAYRKIYQIPPYEYLYNPHLDFIEDRNMKLSMGNIINGHFVMEKWPIEWFMQNDEELQKLNNIFDNPHPSSYTNLYDLATSSLMRDYVHYSIDQLFYLLHQNLISKNHGNFHGILQLAAKYNKLKELHSYIQKYDNQGVSLTDEIVITDKMSNERLLKIGYFLWELIQRGEGKLFTVIVNNIDDRDVLDIIHSSQDVKALLGILLTHFRGRNVLSEELITYHLLINHPILLEEDKEEIREVMFKTLSEVYNDRMSLEILSLAEFRDTLFSFISEFPLSWVEDPYISEEEILDDLHIFNHKGDIPSYSTEDWEREFKSSLITKIFFHELTNIEELKFVYDNIINNKTALQTLKVSTNIFFWGKQELDLIINVLNQLPPENLVFEQCSFYLRENDIQLAEDYLLNKKLSPAAKKYLAYVLTYQYARLYSITEEEYFKAINKNREIIK